MINNLICIFIAMAAYGFIVGMHGAALLSAGMIVVLVIGRRELAKRDAEFYASPASAKTIPDTLEAMDKQEVESSGSRF